MSLFHRLSIYDLRRLNVALECCTGILPQVSGVWAGGRALATGSDVFAAAERRPCQKNYRELTRLGAVLRAVRRSVPRKCFGPRGVCASR